MQKGTEVRERVLARSAEHFFRRGYRQVTSEELAREAGISKRTLYQHFRSKEEILEKVLEREMERIASRLDAVLQQAGLPYPQKLEAVLQIAADQLARLGAAMIEDLYRSAPRLWAQIAQSRQRILFGRLEGLMREGTEAGILRPDVDLQVSLALLRAAMEHLMSPEQVSRLSLTPRQIFDSLLRILLGGLLTDEARQRIPEPPAEGDPR